ncbi:ferric reductase-like transmembrane domain-containing protein [Alsobacter sp. R-9]
MAARRSSLIWAAFAVAVLVPIALAAMSPLMAWRDGVYIASGFAGIGALALLLAQPLLVGGHMPGLQSRRGRRVHRWLGAALVVLVVGHVIGLWLTSAPDVIDALLFRSPTPFSPWGVVAMWAVFAAAALAAVRTRLRMSPKVWRVGHTVLAIVIVVGTVVHALLVEGTMEPLSKAAFCGLVLLATASVVMQLRAWSMLTRGRPSVERS